MNDGEVKALVSLLDDEDVEIVHEIEAKIKSLGEGVIPYLEEAWENSFNPVFQERLEDLIHHLQFDSLIYKLQDWRDNRTEDLLEGMWLVALYQYPDLELKKLRADLEQMYYDVWLEFKPDIHYIDQIKILNSVIFNKLKFSPNTKNFHSPGNSMINVVLESRKGNPISLCVIYMMIAQKLKIPIYGVNLPNLFILTYKTEQAQFYINAFNRGLIFTKQDIDSYLTNLNLSENEIFYEPTSNLEIIKRVFRNLVASFEKLGEHDKVEEIKLLMNSLSK
ncbi:MAG: transglutaminase-like domain-containing protein [Bacteroidota bacterium]